MHEFMIIDTFVDNARAVFFKNKAGSPSWPVAIFTLVLKRLFCIELTEHSLRTKASSGSHDKGDIIALSEELEVTTFAKKVFRVSMSIEFLTLF